MKYFSFKILILCILLPPVLYIASIQSIEVYLKNMYKEKIEEIYTGDTHILFDGNVRLKDALNRNITRYLSNRSLISYGLTLNVSVKTKEGIILYPSSFNEEDPLASSDPMQIASENYNLMKDGLVISVDVKINHNTLISNCILSFYTICFAFVLYFYYKSSVKKAKMEDEEKTMEISLLRKSEKNFSKRLKSLAKERENYLSELKRFKKIFADEKSAADKNEEEMIKEILLLENKIEKNIVFQNKQQKEIDLLKDEIRQYEKERKKETKQQKKSSNIVRKRFKALYKNIYISERAIRGFVELTDEMKIKGEEIIQLLNKDPNQVPVKRKVFGKKKRTTTFESVFAYNGRLYYRKTKDNKAEILAIGTKNTQTKDLEFLNKI